MSDKERYFWDKAKDIQAKSTKKGWPCDIDYKFLIELYDKQEGKCAYSGLPILPIKQEKVYNTLSIDRQDSSKYYTKDNIVLCVLCLNYLKSNFDMEEIQNVFDAITLKNRLTVKVKMIAKDEKIKPVKQYDEDAGLDLFVNEIIDVGDYVQIKTGVSIQPQGDYYTAVYNRSSNYKKGIGLSNGVAIIDKNYTGEIILNFLKYPNYNADLISVGDKVAQMILHRQIYIEPEWVDELPETTRGDKGWGSTGA